MTHLAPDINYMILHSLLDDATEKKNTNTPQA